jgi:hypothetical protein
LWAGAGTARAAAKPLRMTDDVDARLDALERRLDGLQRELGGEPPPRAPAEPPASRRAPDPLDAFGAELRRLAAELVAAYDRVLAHERGAVRSRHRILLAARADPVALAELQRALAGDGEAALVVEVS